MNFVCTPSTLRGTAAIPGSKSHTLRALAIGAMATGESVIRDPLESEDTLAGVRAVTVLGANVEKRSGTWRIRGTGGCPVFSEKIVDVGNSGTTLRILLGLAALAPKGELLITGDDQIRRRPAAPLAAALNDLGANVVSVQGTGSAPFRVRGTLTGGHARIACTTSQYLTSLLICCPLAAGDTELDVVVLNERPYAEMTLKWLADQRAEIEYDDDLRTVRIPGGQRYRAVDARIPADFSSATFFLGAGALDGNEVTCTGLDMTDTQPDKAVAEYLRAMGADVTVSGNAVSVRGTGLRGIEIDMNRTPDALPVMAVLGCFADGRTVLRNVPQARIKETDRIRVMHDELAKLGADIEELEDGLIVRRSVLRGADVRGQSDHRVVMALSLAGTHIVGTTRIDTAEAVAVTLPGFVPMMRELGARIEQSAAT